MSRRPEAGDYAGDELATARGRPVAPPVPCHNCGHEPGAHRGWQGQAYRERRDRPRCTVAGCRCRGYRDRGPKIVEN